MPREDPFDSIENVGAVSGGVKGGHGGECNIIQNHENLRLYFVIFGVHSGS